MNDRDVAMTHLFYADEVEIRPDCDPTCCLGWALDTLDDFVLVLTSGFVEHGLGWVYPKGHVGTQEHVVCLG